MKQEDKELLLKDLSARLPYGIYANLPNHHLVSHKYYIHELNIKNEWTNGLLYCAGRKQIYGAKIEDIQLYLRSLSSMTGEERKEYQNFIFPCPDYNGKVVIGVYQRDLCNAQDWLNAHHFDYRGLIEKNLALEAPEGMYKLKEK